MEGDDEHTFLKVGRIAKLKFKDFERNIAKKINL